MKLRGSIVVIICCFLLQFSNLAQKRYTFSLCNNVMVVCFQGLMFLIYPLLGHLADVYLTRYRTLKCGLVILVTGGISVALWVLVTAIIDLNTIIGEVGEYAIGCLIGFGGTIGIGLFEANAIQFGLDQLLEAPTPKLISFIHWYYWSQNVAGLVVFYIYCVGYLVILEVCRLSIGFSIERIVVIAGCLVLFLATVAAFVLIFVSKKHLYI